MTTTRIAWFGDVVGKPGRAAFAAGAAHARDALGADLVIVNGENARHGIGLHPTGYAELRAAGADVVTLGDHALDDAATLRLAADPAEPLIGPSNIDGPAEMKRSWVVSRPSPWRPLAIVVVQGALFMREGTGDPFEALEACLGGLALSAPGALVLVEVHAEATSEKIALTHRALELAPDRVVAVVGTHTHVQTNDARVVGGRIAAVTDLGMCGSTAGVIGFSVAASLRRFSGQTPRGLELAEGDAEAQGALIEIDPVAGRAVSCELIRVPAPE